MRTRFLTMTAAVALTAALSLAGGVAGPGVHAASGANAKASQTCTANKNAVFGSSVKVTHGACVSAITSQGRSSALWSSFCASIVKSNSGTLSGVAPSTAAGFLSATTTSTISKILAAVTMPSSGKFASTGACMHAINMAKTKALTTSGSGHGNSGTSHGNSGTTHGNGKNK